MSSSAAHEIPKLIWKQSALKESIDGLKLEAESFVKLYKAKKLPGNPSATLHLISYYKESQQLDRGIELWTWAVHEDDQYVNIGTYGAAIELLTVYGKSLLDCEELYLHALRRFPTDFNEYHLSPSAIVPLRHQPTLLRGTSMLLLQGIMQARLSHGDWRSAYLALDTALRLHPTQIPPRFLQAFEYERPWFEVFNVYCLIGESGNLNSPAMLTKLLGNIATAHSQDQRGPRDFEYLTAMLSALHLTMASNAQLNVTTLDAFLRIVLEVVSSNPTSNPTFPTDEQIISKLIKPILSIFAHLHILPSFPTFRLICRVAALSKRPHLMQWAGEEFEPLMLHSTTKDMRTLFSYIGEKGDSEMIRMCWVMLKQNLLENDASTAIPFPYWKMLAKATKRVDDLEFLHDQLEIHLNLNSEVMDRLDQEVGGIKPNKGVGNRSESDEKVDFDTSKAITLSTEPEAVTTSSKAVTPKTEVSFAEPDTRSTELESVLIKPDADSARPEPISTESEAVSLDWQQNFSDFLEKVHRCQQITVSGIHRDLKQYPPPSDTVWAWTDNVEEVWQRKLYDQLNQESDVQSTYVLSAEKQLANNGQSDPQIDVAKNQLLDPKDRKEPMLCPTGFTIEELRYRSWKGINNLLVQAEAFETIVEKSVNEAIIQGTHSGVARSTHQTRGQRYHETTKSHLEMHLQALQENKTRTLTEEDWRTKILALRSLATSSSESSE